MKCLHTMSWSGCHTVHVHHWSATQEEWLPCLQSKLCTVHLQQRKTLEIKLWEKSKQKCKKKNICFCLKLYLHLFLINSVYTKNSTVQPTWLVNAQNSGLLWGFSPVLCCWLFHLVFNYMGIVVVLCKSGIAQNWYIWMLVQRCLSVTPRQVFKQRAQ